MSVRRQLALVGLLLVLVLVFVPGIVWLGSL